MTYAWTGANMVRELQWPWLPGPELWQEFQAIRAQQMGGETVSGNNYVNHTIRPDLRAAAQQWLDTHTLRRFKLLRLEDVHGVSGEGVVAEGVQFSDGKVAVRWIVGDYRTTVPHDDIRSVEHIHGHDGRTQIVWVD